MTWFIFSLFLLTAVTVVLWRLIGSYSRRISGYFLKRLRNDTLNEPWSRFAVFSAETANAKEAEFINDSVPEKKVARFFRLLLLLSYLILAVLLFFNRLSSPN